MQQYISKFSISIFAYHNRSQSFVLQALNNNVTIAAMLNQFPLFRLYRDFTFPDIHLFSIQDTKTRWLLTVFSCQCFSILEFFQLFYPYVHSCFLEFRFFPFYKHFLISRASTFHCWTFLVSHSFSWWLTAYIFQYLVDSLHHQFPCKYSILLCYLHFFDTQTFYAYFTWSNLYVYVFLYMDSLQINSSKFLNQIPRWIIHY